VATEWEPSETVGAAPSEGSAERDLVAAGLQATVSSVDHEPRPSLRLPATFGPYRVLQKIGQGGMGEVHEAIHETLERHVAIKFLRAQVQDTKAAGRLLNEARATNRIQHPGLIEVSDSGVLADGTAYIVMELLRGETLGRRAQRLGGRLPLRFTLHIGWQIASTLAAAHEKGIIHRDLKPENVMLVPDNLAPLGERAKLLDFGLAKLRLDAAPAHGVTQSQEVLGTPLFMSPEQCRGAGKVDEKTDVYSLGVVLYALLAGRPPFSGEGVGDLIHQHLGHAPPPLSGFDPTLPAVVVQFVHRLLHKSPADRPSMADVVTELAQRYADLSTSEASHELPRGLPAGGPADLPNPQEPPASANLGAKKESGADTHSESRAATPTVPSEPAAGVARTESLADAPAVQSGIASSHPSLGGAASGVLTSPSWWRRPLLMAIPGLLLLAFLAPRFLLLSGARPAPRPQRIAGQVSPADTALPSGPTVTPPLRESASSVPAAAPAVPVAAPAQIVGATSAPAPAPAASGAPAPRAGASEGVRPKRGAPPAPGGRSPAKRATTARRPIFHVIDD
jgi:serine/threonine protein kinase